MPTARISVYRGKYRVNELERARNDLINRLYDLNQNDYYRQEKTTCEIKLKRKLGIFTQDVLDYYVEGKLPSCISLNENLSCSNDEVQITENGTKSIKLDESSEIIDDSLHQNVPLDVEQTHSCEEYLMFCPKNIELFNELNEDLFQNKKLSIVFLCDSCKSLMRLEENMVKHLNEKQHFSASVYCVDEESQKFYLRARCKIKNLNSTLDANIFCPKCYFFFGSNILACCLHFKYVHRQHNNNELVYSVSNPPIKEVEIELSREYKCLSCFLKFKKLTDFSYHLENTKHFPHPENGSVVNVFYCPVDNCEFRSIEYTKFKIHILTHPCLQKTFDNPLNEVKLVAKVKIYEKPKGYFHVKKFNGKLYADKVDELAGIESLLDNLKGHAEQSECVKKLKARKDEIYKTLNRR